MYLYKLDILNVGKIISKLTPNLTVKVMMREYLDVHIILAVGFLEQQSGTTHGDFGT